MTQTILPFITDTSNPFTPTSGGAVAISNLVFDADISSTAQSYYLALMQALQSAYNNFIDSQTNTSGGNYGIIPTTGAGIDALSSTQINSIMSTLGLNNFIGSSQALNLWAHLVTINGSGVQQDPAFNAKTSPSVVANDAYNPSVAVPGLGGAYSANLTTTMSKEMAQALEKMNRLLRAGGFDVNNTATAADGNLYANLQKSLLKALIQIVPRNATGDTVYNLDDSIAIALSAAQGASIIGNAFSGSDSLQEILMTQYVARGNEMLFDEMSNLRDAIDHNQAILSFLNSLQDLMNQKDPSQFVLQLQNLSSSSLLGGAANDAYNNYETDTFNQTIGTTADFTDSTLANYANTLAQNQGGNPPEFAAAFQDYSSVTNPNNLSYIKQRLINNITALRNQLIQDNVSQASPLLNALAQISTDLTNAASIQTWVQDFSTSSAGTTGDNQNHLNNAIAASQSFNDTQREQLQSVTFVYEEFYKSATGLLSRLTQLIEKVASMIRST